MNRAPSKVLHPLRTLAAAAAALTLTTAPLPAQDNPPSPAPTNHVLELDGDGDYVELPSNIFNELTAATVEGTAVQSMWRMWV